MVKYKLTVDEPWGFNHNGSNILHGIVTTFSYISSFQI